MKSADHYKLWLRGILPLILLAVWSSASTLAYADCALVIGVQKYPGLVAPEPLSGADNDARAMSRKLTSCGFSVTTLLDERATRHGILEALRTIAAGSSPSERFVFYFAGHGARDLEQTPVILPSDANSRRRTNYITRDELFEAIDCIHTSGRTVLLDACSSGAMARGSIIVKGLHKKLTSRYYDFFGVDGHNPAPVDNVIGVKAMTRNFDICYFAAATSSEPAFEKPFGDAWHGVFTYSLLQHLSAQRRPWTVLQRQVAGDVTSVTQSLQHTALTAAYANVDVFNSRNAPPDFRQKAVQTTLWNEFCADHQNDRKLSLEMKPLRSTLYTDEKFTLKAKVASAGYLIVIEVDTDGSLNLLYPESGNADDARLQAAANVSLPTDSKFAYSANEAGGEYVKAIWLARRDDAEEVLRPFSSGAPIPSWEAAQMHPITVHADARLYYTSGVSFLVESRGDEESDGTRR